MLRGTPRSPAPEGRGTPARMRLRVVTPLRRVAALLALAAAPLSAQDGEGGLPAPPVDTAGLAHGAPLEMLYERTLFGVDVLRLRLVFGPGTADELEALVRDRSYGEALADSVARTALGSRDVLVRSRFLRDVGLDPFLDGLRENLRRAREAGILTAAQEATLVEETAEQYAPFRARGFLDGETMWWRIRGDSLHVVVQGRDGTVLLEERAVGPGRRLAVLGSYLAPESDFREPLVRSAFRER